MEPSRGGAALPEHPTARLISNPGARGGERLSQLRAAAGALAERGWAVSWSQTTGPGHATDLARAAATEGVDVVLAAGGDGTVNEVACGLVYTDTALGILPAGTGNVLAAQLGLVPIPTPLNRPDPVSAAGKLAAGTVKGVDTGYARARGRPARHFVMAAGVGLDAEVTRAVETGARKLKKALGPAAYGALGLRAVLEAEGTPAIARCNGERLRGDLILAVVSNIQLYGGALDLVPAARMDDGLLDVRLFFGAGARAAMAHVGSVLRHRGDGTADASVHHLRLVTERQLPVQLDGEPYGATPVTIVSQPRSLRLLVPEGAPGDLFVDAAAG